eukprot:PhF_6_TR30555/c0_g2_i1/m.44867
MNTHKDTVPSFSFSPEANNATTANTNKDKRLVTITHNALEYTVSWGGKKQGAIDWIVNTVEASLSVIDSTPLVEASESYEDHITSFLLPNGEKQLMWFIPTAQQIMSAKLEHENEDDSKSEAASIYSAGTSTTNTSKKDDDAESTSSRTTASSTGASQILISNTVYHHLHVYSLVCFVRLEGSEALMLTAENIHKYVTVGVFQQGTGSDYITTLLARSRRVILCKSQDHEHFLTLLDENAQNLGDIRLLVKPSKQHDIEASQKGYIRAAQKSEIVRTFEQTVDRWCEDVSHTLSEAQNTFSGDEDGPIVEFAFWKHRYVILSCYLDQLQTRNNKAIIAVLTAAGVRGQKALTKWKAVEQALENAASEAQDNVKYLSTMEKHFWPMYSPKPNPTLISDSIGGLIHGLRMTQGISRFYHTSLRLTSFMVRITNQLIA